MGQTGANTTSQPYHTGTPTQILRKGFESELWDDLANVVFDLILDDFDQAENVLTAMGSLTIPCPVPTRMEISISAGILLPGGAASYGRIHVNEGGNPDIIMPIAITGNGMAATISRTQAYDVAPGVYTLDVVAESGAFAGTYTFADSNITVRRGRRPAE